MAEQLKVYKDDAVVETVDVESEGATTATISGLTEDTSYPKGTYKVAISNEAGESDKVDVPEFKTDASAPE